MPSRVEPTPLRLLPPFFKASANRSLTNLTGPDKKEFPPKLPK